MARRRHDEGAPVDAQGGAPAEGRLVSPTTDRLDEDAAADAALRPTTLSEFVGQSKITENLGVYVAAARKRASALDHVLLSGPPGLGKTTLAFVLAHEMGTNVRVVSGPALERKGDLAGLLTGLEAGDVLFIDEIHRLPAIIEESLYPAMEDFRIEIMTGSGAGATAITLPLRRFTLVGATTRTGQLTSPLLSRFGIVERFEYYGAADLTRIVKRSAHLLGVPIDDAGAEEIGRRSRGTPRVANRLLRRVRDFAEVRGDGKVTRAAAEYALERLEIDRLGLDAADRRLLRAIIERFEGGPVGIESLAAALADDRDTLEFVYEPYLIQEGFLVRTPRGREATKRAYEHLGIPHRVRPRSGQGSLF